MAGCDNLSNLHKSSTVTEMRSLWYFSQKEIEMSSPSRLDGIDWVTENQLRASYCSFIQNLGIQLGMPQITIATAIVFCHRFYLRQSHARNDWETVATVCLFVASKVEETPCYLDKITSVAYQLKHRKNPAAAAQRIQVKEVFLRQKELILVGETLLLATIGFDLNIQHPYKPLISAVKRLGLPNNVARVAWNFLNDWLRTTLYLQYKPHYIAAGSLYLAAKISNVRLSSDKGPVWWQEFDVLPRQLDESVQHMMDIMGYKRRAAVPDAADKTVPAPTEVKETQQSNSSESCISSLGEGSSPMVDNVLEHKQTLPKQDTHLDGFYPNTKSSSMCGKSGLKRQYSDSHCCSGVVYHGNVKNAPGKTRLDFPRCAATQDVSLPNRLDMSSVDTERTREKLKRRRFETVNNDATCNPRQHSWGRHQ